MRRARQLYLILTERIEMMTRLMVLLLAALLLACGCDRQERQPGAGDAPPIPKAPNAPGGGFVNNPKSGLRTLEVGSGSQAFILLHGYGASAEQWMPFTETIRASEKTRFVFPQAPESGGGGWWPLDLANLNRGEPLPDLSGSRPQGIDSANQKTRALLRDVETRLGSGDGPPILGGYSQGAMTAADVAFTTDEPLKALIILSGAFVDEAGWMKGMAKRKGLPVFISHGEKDDLLQYGIAIRLRDAMKRAGLQVSWVPFDGGHEIPAEVVTALNTFLERLD